MRDCSMCQDVFDEKCNELDRKEDELTNLWIKHEDLLIKIDELEQEIKELQEMTFGQFIKKQIIQKYKEIKENVKSQYVEAVAR